MSKDLALVAERLRDDLDAFRRKVRKQYAKKGAQISANGLRREAAALAERGLVDLASAEQFANAVGTEVTADLNIEFQRLLTASGKSATRATYEDALSGILDDFARRVVIPIKQVGARTFPAPRTSTHSVDLPKSAFLGHSFDANDSQVVACVRDSLELIGIEVVTGERPRADRISEKVKTLIDAQPMFVGLYTRRQKIARQKNWTTSAWVIEEKAYAVAMRKKLLLIKEDGISSIGGIQGDYEYIEFRRDELHAIVLKILRLFRIRVEGFAQ
jgi:hypothetical protein